MTESSSVLPSLHRIKQRAKKLRRELGITHMEALTKISQEFGFDDWLSFQAKLIRSDEEKVVSLISDTEFDEYKLEEINADDFISFDEDRTSEFIPFFQTEQNKRYLARLGIEFSIFEPTDTGLKKSILDATHTVRTHFELEEFHFYWNQSQGPEHKVTKKAYFITDEEKTQTIASFYRPNTKQGDPRMWFKGLPSFAKSGDQIAIIILNGIPNLINLSVTDLKTSLTDSLSNIHFFLQEFNKQSSTTEELLLKLKKLAQSPYPALKAGDTAVGYTLETKLGLKPNSQKTPDYKGIELKSGRDRKTRTTLFAQVPDWSKSPCKKSADILNKYGYIRGDNLKLYSTISAKKENSQGLSFNYNQSTDELEEKYKRSELVAVWPGELLRKRLKQKHTETFWIEAKSINIDGIEHFQLVSVIHTRFPILSQLIPLIESGIITMDHLIKRNAQGRVSEKGPLFKINKSDLDLLFPEPIKYQLGK